MGFRVKTQNMHRWIVQRGNIGEILVYTRVARTLATLFRLRSLTRGIAIPLVARQRAAASYRLRYVS